MVMDSIISKGQVVRGWIGVEPRDITPELAENLGLPKKDGVIIAAVLKNGPADKSGIRPGDILISIGGKTISNMAEMFNLIAQLQPGTQTDVIVLRDDKDIRVNVGIGKRPMKKHQEVDE